MSTEKPSVTVSRNGVKIGRPTKYDPDFIEVMLDYFDVDVEDLARQGVTDGGKPYAAYKIGKMPSFRGFARSIGTWPDVLIEWTKLHPEFKTAYARCLDHLAYLKAELARGVDRPNGLLFDLRCNHGWRDNDSATPVAVTAGTKLVMEFVADKPADAAEKPAQGADNGEAQSE